MKKKYLFYSIFIFMLGLISFWMQNCTKKEQVQPKMASDPIIETTWEITAIVIEDQVLQVKNEDCLIYFEAVLQQHKTIYGDYVFEDKNRGSLHAPALNENFSWNYDMVYRQYMIRFDEAPTVKVHFLKKNQYLLVSLADLEQLLGSAGSGTTKEFLKFWGLTQDCPNEFKEFNDDAFVYLQYSKK